MEGKVVERAVGEYFGTVVGRVAGVLAKRGPMPLPALVQITGFPLRSVKESLFTLLHHGYIQWRERSMGSASIIEYICNNERVMLLLYGMPWLFKYAGGGESKEALVELMVMGMVPFDPLKHATLSDEGILETVSSLECSKNDTVNDSPRKKRARTTPSVPFVRISVSGFMQFYRKQILIQHVSRCINEAAGKLVAHLLSVPAGRASATELSRAVPEAELKIDWRGSGKDTRPPIVHYMETLARVFPFITRQTLSSPHDRTLQTYYSVSLPALPSHFETLAYLALLEKRLSPTATRIARCLLAEGPLDDKILGEMLLMTAKEVREVCFQMLSLGFLQLQEVPKTLDHAPSRTIFLWNIERSIVRRNLSTRLHQVMLDYSERLERLARVNSDLVEKAQQHRARLSEGERKSFSLYSQERMILQLQRSFALLDALFFTQ
jgi:hypothetical protein